MATEHTEKKQAVSRRTFIRNAATAAVGTAAVSAVTMQTAKAEVYKSILPQTVLGANETVRLGMIGIGTMGRNHMKAIFKREDLKPVALCDLYPRNLEKAAGMLGQRFPELTPTQHKDFREVIDNKDVDAVLIATSDHWHCLCTLYAAEAKKAIYCEKPLSTTIEEGRAMVESVRRNKVVFQGGTMQRSGPHFQEAVALIKSGYIGKISRVETFNHENTPIKGFDLVEGHDNINDPKWAGLDWDFYQGWVEHKPFDINRWIYNFRWYLDYSGGKITDWGTHLIDIALMAMGEEKQPKSVVAVGKKFLVEDLRTTPDTLEALWEFDDYVLSFSNRVCNGYLPKGYQDHGILFHGTLGTMVLDRGGFEVIPVANNEGCEAKKVQNPADVTLWYDIHWQNFLDCMKSGQDPTVNVEQLYNTTRVCHMGTCAYVADGKLKWDAATEKFVGEDEATKRGNEWAYRPYLNGWSLKAPFRVA